MKLFMQFKKQYFSFILYINKYLLRKVRSTLQSLKAAENYSALSIHNTSLEPIMLFGSLIIISFYCLGEWAQQQLALPVPGSVIGMLGLFCYLVCLGKTPLSLSRSSQAFISHLTLLLIPSCVGLMTCLNLLQHNGWLITLFLMISISLSAAITGCVLYIFSHRMTYVAEQAKSKPTTDQC